MVHTSTAGHPAAPTRASRRPCAFLATAVCLVVIADIARPACGQTIAEPAPTAAIPRDSYKSWSLFLVCNPEWVAPERNADLHALYRQFRTFGRTIGDDHLAVWFWRHQAIGEDPKLADSLDVERSIRFCKALTLKPSAGPHIVVTKDYPDESAFPRDRAIFELADLAPNEVSKLLGKLTDDLVLTGRVDPQAGSGHSVQRPVSLWIRLLEAAQSSIVGLGCKVNVKIQTAVLSAELRECRSQ